MTAYNSSHTGAEIDNIVSNILNLVYPVGSIYISLNGTDTSTLFGGVGYR